MRLKELHIIGNVSKRWFSIAKSPTTTHKKNYGTRAISGSVLLAIGLAFTGNYMQNESFSQISSNFSKKKVSLEELSKHKSKTDCWISIDDQVYDITDFISNHSGGSEVLLGLAGSDVTHIFKSQHPPSIISNFRSVKKVGVLDSPSPENLYQSAGSLNHRLYEITGTKDQISYKKPPLDLIFNVSEFEDVAKHVLPKSSYVYFSSAADDEITYNENLNSYKKIFFKPRVLQDVDNPNLETFFLGNKVDAPFYITAFAGSSLAHDRGERNLFNAAGKEGIILMIPIKKSVELPELAKTATKSQVNFHQVHLFTKEQFDNAHKTFAKIQTELPNVKAIFINVHLPVLGNREKDCEK